MFALLEGKHFDCSKNDEQIQIEMMSRSTIEKLSETPWKTDNTTCLERGNVNHARECNVVVSVQCRCAEVHSTHLHTVVRPERE